MDEPLPSSEQPATATARNDGTRCPYTRFADLYVSGFLFSWEQDAFEMHVMECGDCLQGVERARKPRADGAAQSSSNTRQDSGSDNTAQGQEDGTSCRSIH